ncbi:uncharacterized protein [Littorina saxatilis]|uniref:uncharacterized protein n=1 Tax=Littorina saxatilis TaxID=31220 RepID=UPI0038B5D3C2
MPNKHTGELIGVEYMYSQTGRALQYVPADTEDAKKEDAGDDDEEEESADEGFHDLTEVDDMTMADASMVVFATSASYLLFCPDQMGRHHPTSNPHCKQSPTTPPPTPTASSLPPPTPYPHCKQSPTNPPPTPTYAARRTSSISATSSWPFLLTSQTTAFSTLCSVPDLLKADPNQCLGPDGVPGFEKVSHLANFLVGLRDQVTPLTNGQVSEIVCLWYKMDTIDQRPSVITPRFHPSPKDVLAYLTHHVTLILIY